jgi:hypothetical protein
VEFGLQREGPIGGSTVPNGTRIIHKVVFGHSEAVESAEMINGEHASRIETGPILSAKGES